MIETVGTATDMNLAGGVLRLFCGLLLLFWLLSALEGASVGPVKIELLFDLTASRSAMLFPMEFSLLLKDAIVSVRGILKLEITSLLIIALSTF